MWSKKTQETSKHFSLRTAARISIVFPFWMYAADSFWSSPASAFHRSPRGQREPLHRMPTSGCFPMESFPNGKGTFHFTIPLRRGVPTLWFIREFLHRRYILITFTISWYLCYNFHLIHEKQVCKYHSYWCCGSCKIDPSLII